VSELGERIYERAHRKRALIVLGVATVAFTVILEVIDPSHVSHGPTILDFEFAGSHTHAAQIVAEWGAKGRSAAHLSLLLDYGLCRRRHKRYYVDFRIMGIRRVILAPLVVSAGVWSA
jgi:hypothetical protein